MTLLDGLPIWALALAIFALRVVDVSVGTMRTIAVVQGRIAFSVLLGFCEVLIWVTVVNQVFRHASDQPLILVAYACGFATGNAAGIALERSLALGSVILRIVTATAGEELAEFLRDRAPRVYTFDGRNGCDPMTMLYVVVRRRQAREVIQAAQKIDPDLFFSIDPMRESNAFLSTPLPHATGWRSVVKMK